jgi:protein SCO1/2
MSTPPTSKLAVRLVVVGIAVAVGIVAALFVRDRMRRPAGPPLPVISGISGFTLTNHLGRTVGLDDLRGRVTVASVIFTRCPGPCLAMSRKFAEIQEQLPADGSVRLWSFTIDPEFDTPEVLTAYGRKLETDPERWWFVTGPKQEIARLAVKDFKFVVLDKAEEQREVPDDLFIHSTYFMVLDTRGRVRAVIEGAEADAVERTLEMIERVKHER